MCFIAIYDFMLIAVTERNLQDMLEKESKKNGLSIIYERTEFKVTTKMQDTN